MVPLNPCPETTYNAKRVVITGGPGAGKTAVLELARKKFCDDILVLPEAASILFSGGFWRQTTPFGQMATQRAIFHVQCELEKISQFEKKAALVLCDRGTLDGLAYWPGDEESFWKDVHSTKAIEQSRYAAVIHLRTPSLLHGYNHDNPVRHETPQEAAEIDRLIELAWKGHPRRFVVDSEQDFLSKALIALKLIENEIPDCCRVKA